MLDALSYQFIQNALIAGTCTALIAAIIGYFMIMRGLSFAGHALPNIAFAGAAGAVMLGIAPVYGLFVFTIGSGIGIALLGTKARERDITIGVIMTFALGLGLMFLSLYSGYAARVYSILFGTILGISRGDVLTTAIFSLLVFAGLLFLFRPLLFSSFDPDVAEARGLPMRLLAISFMVLLAITVSISIQIVGALLLFTLLIGPAATASRIFQRPAWVILLACGLGVCYIWFSIIMAFEFQDGSWPVSFYLASISFLVYLPVRLLSPLWQGRNSRKAETRLITHQEQEKQPAAIEDLTHFSTLKRVEKGHWFQLPSSRASIPTNP
jgi:zinc/manganese transport system permease protein